MLKFYTGFEINDQTGNALTQKEMTTLHYDRITSLQVNGDKLAARTTVPLCPSFFTALAASRLADAPRKPRFIYRRWIHSLDIDVHLQCRIMWLGGQTEKKESMETKLLLSCQCKILKKHCLPKCWFCFPRLIFKRSPSAQYIHKLQQYVNGMSFLCC